MSAKRDEEANTEPVEISADGPTMLEVMLLAASFSDNITADIFVHDVPVEFFALDNRLRDAFPVTSEDGKSKWLACPLKVDGCRIYLMSTKWSTEEEAS